MRLTTIYPIFLVLILFMQSCVESGNHENQSEISANDSTLVLRGLSKELSIQIPKELLANDNFDSEYNSNFGQLELRLGDSFEIYITEEKLSLMGMREELNNDQLFSYQFEVESDSELVFQSILPDGNPHSYQFVKSRNLNGLQLIVRTAPMGNFNKQQLKRMEDAVATLSLVE